MAADSLKKSAWSSLAHSLPILVITGQSLAGLKVPHPRTSRLSSTSFPSALKGTLSYSLALSPGHQPQGGTPDLSTELSGRITPFCLLTAAQSCRGPFLLPAPTDNTPGQEGPLLPAQPSPTRIHTDSLSSQHQASAALLGSVTARARQAGPQPQRPSSPECPSDPRGCPGCLGNHFRSLETERSLIPV